MCFPVWWSILGTINVRQVSAYLLQGRFSMAEFNERRRFMGRFRKIIFTLTVTLFLAAGVTIVTGLGSMSEKQNDTEQGQQNLRDSISRVHLLKPVIRKISSTTEGIKLTWTAVENADGYLVKRNEKTCKNITNPEEVSFLDKKAKKNGRKYKYVIYAYREVNGKKIKSEPSESYTQFYLKRTSINDASRGENGDVTVVWKKNEKASGFEIQYNEKKNFHSAQCVYARKSSAISSKIPGLKAGKTVYVRVRSYKKAGKKKYYSQWSTPVMLTGWNQKWKYAGNSKIHSGTAVLYYTDSSDRRKKTVCINAGHGTLGGEAKKTLCHPDGSPKVTGGTTAQGAVYSPSISGGTTMTDGTPEAAANLQVALLLKKKLLNMGYNVLMIRESPDVQLDNIARTVLANQYADCHVSIHFDSTAYNKGAFVINVPNIASYRKMEPVASHWQQHNELAEQILRGMQDEGVKIYGNGTNGIDLTQTSYSTVPSVDVEVGDTRTSLAKKSLETISDGIAAGVDRYFMVSSK